MRRFVALALAVVMIFAFAVSVAAKPSPTGKEYYKISVSVEYPGKGTADASVNKVEKGTDGTVTLTASETGGFFTRWIISGDYVILDGGTIEDPVITIMPSSDIKAIANFRVDADVLHIYTDHVSDGTVSTDKPTVPVGSNEVVTLTAVDGADTFQYWDLKGDYTVVSGDMKSRTLKIIPYTDIYATVYFKNSGGSGGNNGSSTSPKTGDPLYAVIPFMTIALAAAFISMKKLKEN